MVSNETSSNGAETAPAHPAPPEGKSEETHWVASNAVPFPLPSSEVAPAILENSLNVTGPSFSERRIAFSATSHRPLEENDAVIVLMGATGTGKSSFVNTAAGREEVAVGCGLRSHTRTVQQIRCSHPDGCRNIVIVDTPGFDDTCLSDIQVLKIISNWLKETYQGNIKLSGLLYFHRISDVRFPGTPLKNLSVFKDLCGETNLKNVILVTTTWDELDNESVSLRREEDLLMNFWKNMTRLGSRSCRFQGTLQSAWDIIEHLDLERTSRTPLQIQKEMVDQGSQVHDTTAATTLFGFLIGGVKKFSEKIRYGQQRRINWTWKPFTGSSATPISASSFSTNVDSLNFLSSYSRSRPSPIENTSTSYSVHHPRPTLGTTITGLRLAHKVANRAGIPILRGTIETAIHVAQMIEVMGGTHQIISQVIEQSGRLLQEVSQYAPQHNLHKNMNKMLKTLRTELENVQKVVMKISSPSFIHPYLLDDADIQAITACTASIKAVYAKIEVKFAMDSWQAVARLEGQLKEIRNDVRLVCLSPGDSTFKDMF